MPQETTFFKKCAAVVFVFSVCQEGSQETNNPEY